VNWIGDGSGLIGPVSKWILADEPINLLMDNKRSASIQGNFIS
jgi:hypothetical protein